MKGENKMSRIVEVFDLNPEQQDSLWVSDRCPYCNEKIVNKDLAVDIAYWVCSYCNIQFVVE
jgi:uncharacterized protein with PIN domain